MLDLLTFSLDLEEKLPICVGFCSRQSEFVRDGRGGGSESSQVDLEG